MYLLTAEILIHNLIDTLASLQISLCCYCLLAIYLSATIIFTCGPMATESIFYVSILL